MDFMTIIEQVGKIGIPVVISAAVLFFAIKWGMVKFDLWKKAQEKATSPGPTIVGSSSGAHKTVSKPDAETKLMPAVRPHFKLNPLNHYVFTTIQTAAGVMVPTFTCGGCATRDQLLRDMMRLYLESWEAEITQFCKDALADKDFDAPETAESVPLDRTIGNMLIKVSTRYHNAWSSEGILIPAVHRFDRWHNRVNRIVIEHAKRVAAGAYFPTNRERLLVVLAQLAVSIDITITEARYVLRRMNGDLTGLGYKGHVIQPIPDAHGDDDVGTDGVFPEPPPNRPPSSDGIKAAKKHRSGEWREDDGAGHQSKKSQRGMKPQIPSDEESGP